MPRYLDSKNDLVFKKIFGEHPLLLQDFLNALLPLPEDSQIVKLEYLQPEQITSKPFYFRRGIINVKCWNAQGHAFIVETHIFWTTIFCQRIAFNASQAYVQQVAPGKDYRLLQPVYALGLINDIFDPDPAWYHHYKIVNIDNPQRQIEGLQFVFIELPKFKPETSLDEKVRLLWLRFLKEIAGEQEPPAEMIEYPPIREALTISQEAGFSNAELLAYQDVLDAIRTETSYVGEKVALAMEQGLQQGIEQGIEQGKTLERLAIAANLLQTLDDAAIANITGLPLAEVQNLRAQRQT